MEKKNPEHNIIQIGNYYRVCFRRYGITKEATTLEEAIKIRDEIEGMIKRQEKDEVLSKLNAKDMREQYPTNVIDMVTKSLRPEEMQDIDWVWVEENADKNIQYILSRISNQKGILWYRWVNGETLESIGKEYGVTRERIRQIIAKIAQKVIAFRRYILYPSFYIDYMQVKNEYEEKTAQLKAEVEMVDMKLFDKMPIEELDLPARAYNALRHRQIKTVGQLLEKTEEELIRYRNMGVKSIKDIKKALEKVGHTMGEYYIGD